MKIPHFLFLICLIQSCSRTANQLPPNAKLTAKYMVLNENLSPNHTKCDEVVRPFKAMKSHDCSFILEEFEFDIDDKFILDKDGAVVEYWNYLSEGPLVYPLEELKSDITFFKLNGGSNLLITVSLDGSAIIESEDTMEIERVFLDEKLIFVELPPSVKNNGRRFIYEYKIESAQN